VDSEHNSLFRLLSNFKREEVANIFITASGGPFFGSKFESLTDVSIQDVVRHPIWNMGAKISVDSATMANKGLELLEACKLFEIEESKIDAFVCKGSLLHAGVNLNDGSSLWFLSKPDMKNHISHAILGGSIESLQIPQISPLEISKLTFEELKKDEFPIFFIAREVAKNGDLCETISFNILNEVAVAKFLAGKIKYTEILKIIEKNIGYNPSNHKFLNISEINEYCLQLSSQFA
jgi:1-deoxy-D-xylulose-5-phosphate reductoisomerase